MYGLIIIFLLWVVFYFSHPVKKKDAPLQPQEDDFDFIVIHEIMDDFE